MATPTYELIDSTVLGSSSASVTFSSIPATYRDLVLVVESASGSGFLTEYIQVNSDTGANYNDVYMRGNGSSATSSSSSSSNQIYPDQNSISGTERRMYTAQFFDYSQTDKHKSILIRNSNPARNVQADAARWASTAAINSITLAGGTYAAGSTFYLYGIEA